MSTIKDRPEVTVIVPNLDGRHHLDRCFSSLKALRYDMRRVEFLLVDNGSSDGSVRYLRYRFPAVRIIANTRNLGFCTACNLGARAARGEILVFLNNDMRVDEDWLEPLVEPIRSGEADCTTSLILSWDGTRVNFGGSGSNFHGIGFQEGLDDPRIEAYRTRREVLFGCGGSMALPRALFLDTGGFDEEFFAYFEDVDFGWRLWVLGYRVILVPESTAYHHHSATGRLLGMHKRRVLDIRNPLFAMFKNYEYDNLLRTLPAALLLTVKRTMYLMDLDPAPFRIHGRETRLAGPLGALAARGWGKHSRMSVRRAGMADLVALNDFVDRFEIMLEKRRTVQEARRRSDREIFRLFHRPFWAVESGEEYEKALRRFAGFFGFDRLFEDLDREEEDRSVD